MKTKVGKGLLIHWWHYYGKAIYTFDELERFERLIDKKGVDKILDVAVASFIVGDGSPTALLMAIRDNKAEELLNSLPDIDKFSEEDKKGYLHIKEEFVKIISSTCK